jgi:hypothetical protein
MGLLRFGKFVTCYTDNGKPECSRYIKSILPDIRAWGAESKDVAELYRCKDGYVVEVDEGEAVEMAPSAAAWHRKAQPYNAKAKLIERFFRSFERILTDLGTPGKVIATKGASEQKKEDAKRIDDAIKNDSLFTFSEFLRQIFKAAAIYENRAHGGLKRQSPMGALEAEIKNGFTPRFIKEEELDFALLVRADRSVQRGRIQINGELYEGKDMFSGLWNVETGTKIEVRYDPLDPESIIAVKPDSSWIYLYKVVKSSMKDKGRTAELMERKRAMMKEVVNLYKSLTKPIPGVIEISKATKKAIEFKNHAKPMTKSERLKQAEAAREALLFNDDAEKVVVLPRRPSPALDVYDRYEALLEYMNKKGTLTEDDKQFMEGFERQLDAGALEYWDFQRERLGLPLIGRQTKSANV